MLENQLIYLFFRAVVTKASISVPILGKSLIAHGIGHGQQSSSTNCALSLVQQLHHLGIIKPLPGSIKKTRNVHEILQEFDIEPVVKATLDQLSEKLAKDEYSKIPDLSEWFNESIAMRSQLPIFAKRNDILDLVCQFILDKYLKNGRGAYCNIICALPNSMSAINVAKTVAFERKEDLGLSVGYSVTYDDSILPRSHGAILFCTVERSMNSDILMAIFKDMINYYPSLRVICMSASINTDLFFKYFNCCPVIDVEEKFYPVKEYFIEDIVQMLNYQPTHYSDE
ncbi:hypothetical protein AGLY_007942 [Aphis glycines]|uniref:Uncharacterized protein n=1 Tax=Aphis glycines TaxID=307491 RepID=A0A6G0TMB3_APHGL|nr:hypothetical protein AGLY_007942 [Aphis glycines]